MSTQIITVAGQLGSGKSTLAKEYAKSTGIKRVSAGDVFRESAAKSGSTLEQFMQATMKQPDKSYADIDWFIDQSLTNLGTGDESLILDSRLAWHLVPQSFKVNMLVHPQQAAQRVFSDARETEKYRSVEECLSGLKERRKGERQKYAAKYGVDIEAFSNYDLIIDTTQGDIETAVEIVKLCAEKHFSGKHYPGFWVSTDNLFSIQPMMEINMDCVEETSKKINKLGDVAWNCPVVLGRIGPYNFIMDGHHKTLATIRKNISYVPAKVFKAREQAPLSPGITVEQLLRGEFSLSRAYDWEECVSHVHNAPEYRMWTYPPTFKDAPYSLDIEKMHADDWAGERADQDTAPKPTPL